MPKKRGANEGTIYKRSDGIWAAQITVGIDPATGKLIRKSFYNKSRKVVSEKMMEALQEIKNGVYIEPTKTTFGQWLDKWLVEYKRGKLKPSTYESYETHIKVHIKPALGKIALAKLQANMLQSFYNQKLKSGRVEGKGGLSTRMVRYFHVIIHQSLEQAVREGLLTRNVADATSPPTVQNKKMRPLTESELLKFFEVTKDDRFFAAYVLVATTGLRRGELLGLCWDCVDLEQGIITI